MNMRESGIPDRDETIKYLEDLKERLKETPFKVLKDNYIEQLKATLNYSPRLSVRQITIPSAPVISICPKASISRTLTIYAVPKIVDEFTADMLVGEITTNGTSIDLNKIMAILKSSKDIHGFVEEDALYISKDSSNDLTVFGVWNDTNITSITRRSYGSASVKLTKDNILSSNFIVNIYHRIPEVIEDVDDSNHIYIPNLGG